MSSLSSYEYTMVYLTRRLPYFVGLATFPLLLCFKILWAKLFQQKQFLCWSAAFTTNNQAQSCYLASLWLFFFISNNMWSPPWPSVWWEQKFVHGWQFDSHNNRLHCLHIRYFHVQMCINKWSPSSFGSVRLLNWSASFQFSSHTRRRSKQKSNSKRFEYQWTLRNAKLEQP